MSPRGKWILGVMLGSRLALAVAFALAGALAFAVATVAQQRAAARSSDEEARGPKFFTQLIRRPQWWAGTFGNVAGYALQAVALGFGSLLVVQPIMVTSLVFALPLGARLAHRRLSKAAWGWGLVLIAALALFLTLGHPNRGASQATRAGWLVVAGVGLPVVAACLVAAHRRSGATRASLLAVAVGVLGGALAVLTKAVVAVVPLGLVHLITASATYGLIVVGLSGVYVQQLAFQAGALQASLPVMTVLEPIVASVLGLSLLHEQLKVSGLRTMILAFATVAMTVATVALARGEARVRDVND